MYYLVRFTVKLFMRICFRVHVIGAQNVPATGPVVICCNHRSNWDPALLSCFTPRVLIYMAKAQMFEFKPAGQFMRFLRTFPIKRGVGDRAAIKTALEILADDQALVIFPEGTRKMKGEVKTLQRGVGMISLRSGAPVVPVILYGRYRPFHRLYIAFGPPFTTTGTDRTETNMLGGAIQRKGSGRASIDAATETVALRMRTLLEETIMYAGSR